MTKNEKEWKEKKLNILIIFFLNISGDFYGGLRNSCSIFRAC